MTTALAPRAFKVDSGLHVTALDPLHATTLDKAAEEALRAQDRLRSDPESQDHRDSDDWLIVAPYLEAEHLLDLRSIDTPNRLLALALTQLTAATTDYATVKYEDAFDWTGLMSTLKSLATSEGYTWTRQEFYVVEFRSKLYQNIDRDLLFKLDKESHAEATQAGGLLKYWYGVPNHERRNLATCLWRNKEDAIAGGRGPWHKQARAIISEMYEEINVKGLRLTIEADVESWSFAPYA